MEARPSTIIEFFNGARQMLVPLFQRPYEWGKREWQTLFDDVMEQYERSDADSAGAHFTGAIVTAPARSVPVGVSKFLVIDGQQRLTTLAIILCALRSLVPRDSRTYNRLTNLLINQDEDGLDFYKLLPTQLDRTAFQALVDNVPHGASRFHEAFDYFRDRLRGRDSDDESIDLERMVQTVQHRLMVVSIHLGDADDPYLIFESLNAKGMPLEQADLIRNYLLLRLPVADQERVYNLHWLPMQRTLARDRLSEFMRHHLMLSGDDVAYGAIYASLKKRLLSVPDRAVAETIADMQREAELYAALVGVGAHASASIGAALVRWRRWEIATADPLILKLLVLHSESKLPERAVIECMAMVESFVVRRLICGVPTNQLKKIFLRLTRDCSVEDVPAWLSSRLAAGVAGARWPKDDELREAIPRYRAYSASLDRCRYLLERLELSHGHKEPASFVEATIEHVMPRSLTDEWRTMLGAEHDAVHERMLDTLPNLSLTAYNSELSNHSFEKKRELLRESHFEMNKWIAARERWTEVELGARAEVVFEALRAIWPRP